jgi:hypothetical protein
VEFLVILWVQALAVVAALRAGKETQRKEESGCGWPMALSMAEEMELSRCLESPYPSVAALVTFYRNLGTLLRGEMIDIDAGALSAFVVLELDAFLVKVVVAPLRVIGVVNWGQAVVVATIGVVDSILGSSIL